MADTSFNCGVIGVGGFAGCYLDAMDYLEQRGLGKLAAVVVRSPAKYAKKLDALKAKGVKVYPDLDKMLANEKLDVVGNPTGISDHVPLSVRAMEAGCDVVCEKPLCATVQEAREFMDAQKRTGRRVVVGYQNMNNPATQEIKKQALEGPLGRVKSIRVKCCAPRARSYYDRNPWAGRLKDDKGRWVMDSPANNAIAHWVQHAFYLAGAERHGSARPVKVCAELYRAHPVEDFDTCSIRVDVDSGARLLFVFTHADQGREVGPQTEIECENGSVLHNCTAKKYAITYKDGRVMDLTQHLGYKITPSGPVFLNLAAARTSGETMICTPANTWQQTLLIDAAHDASPINVIAEPFAREQDCPDPYTSPAVMAKYTVVDGLPALIDKCFDEWKTFSEAGAPWGKAGKTIDTSKYDWFPGGKAPAKK
jgi:predicted dehydrogenase